eukprot:gene8090-9639_t
MDKQASSTEEITHNDLSGALPPLVWSSEGAESAESVFTSNSRISITPTSDKITWDIPTNEFLVSLSSGHLIAPMGGVSFNMVPRAEDDKQTVVALRINYAVKFPTEFLWNLGGHLPGLFGTYVSSSGTSAAANDVFECRCRWDAKGKLGVNVRKNSEYDPNEWTISEQTKISLIRDTWRRLVTLPDADLPYIPKKTNTFPKFQACRERTTTEQNLLDCVVLQANEFQLIFPLFLASPQYENWVYDIIFAENTVPVSFDTKVKDPVYKVRPYYLIRNSLQALKTVDREEIPYLHAHGDWIKDLIREVDSVPWSVSLSAARPGRPNFPLVYVNCTFMEQTGFQSDDIIGKPFLSFVCDKDTCPEEDTHQLQESLLLAKPVKVFLTTSRKDGTHFTNLVVSKPLFDARGQYVYAISVQCAIADPATAQKLCQDVEQLLIVLPNILK